MWQEHNRGISVSAQGAYGQKPAEDQSNKQQLQHTARQLQDRQHLKNRRRKIDCYVRVLARDKPAVHLKKDTDPAAADVCHTQRNSSRDNSTSVNLQAGEFLFSEECDAAECESITEMLKTILGRRMIQPHYSSMAAVDS